MKNKVQYYTIAVVLALAGVLVIVFPHFSSALSFLYGSVGLLSGCILWLLYRLMIRTKTGELLVGAAVIAQLAGIFLLLNRWFGFMRDNLLVLAVLGTLGLVLVFASFALKEIKMRQAAKRTLASACGLIVAGIVGAFTIIEASFAVLCAVAAGIMIWIPVEEVVRKKRAEKAAHIVTVPESKIEIIEEEKKE